MDKNIIEFLKQSNLIEKVGTEGMADSIKAYEYIMQIKGDLIEKHLLKTHKLLMKNLNPKIAGKFRNCLVQVGNRICPPVNELPEKIDKFFKLVNTSKNNFSNIEKANYCKLVHINFEAIHPFEDGRTGRLILNWQRKQMGLPLLTIYNNRKYDYYNWFL